MFGVRKAFLNKDWKDVTSKILAENYDKLPLFSPEAFHSFFPAYLIHSLKHFAENDDVCNFAVYTLMAKPKEAEEQKVRWQYRFQFFTKEQLELIREFVDLAIESEEYDIFFRDLEFGKKILGDFVETNSKS